MPLKQARQAMTHRYKVILHASATPQVRDVNKFLPSALMPLLAEHIFALSQRGAMYGSNRKEVPLCCGTYHT